MIELRQLRPARNGRRTVLALIHGGADNPKMDHANAPRQWVAIPLAVALAIATAIAYAILWSLNGASSCGPAGHSASGRIFAAAPFVLPVLAALVLIALATKLNRQRRTVVQAVLTTIGTAAVLAILVFLLEFGSHHCGE